MLIKIIHVKKYTLKVKKNYAETCGHENRNKTHKLVY